MRNRFIAAGFIFLLTHTSAIGKTRVFVSDSVIHADNLDACLQERENYRNSPMITVGKISVPAFQTSLCTDESTGFECACISVTGVCGGIDQCEGESLGR